MTKIKHEYERLGLHGQNQFSIVASEMAYTHGDVYMDALIETLMTNIEWVKAFVSSELPQIKVMDIEGTYLMWLDFRGLNKTQKDLADFLMNQAKLWLNDGSMFGEGGEGFMRVNVATDLETLKQAFHQLKAALND
jgi:cystathionine beta-lyase